LICC